ncbi:MAG: branched-chain amino acid transport system ATP-binding protein, partial [Solirubrobacteraceae bacterium]
MSEPDTLVVDQLVASRGGRRVLHGVSLVVPRGEITALLGADGAGKSTLVLAVAGLVATNAGTVVADDVLLNGLTPERRRAHGVSAVVEGHRVLRGLTVGENLAVAGSRLGARQLRAGLDDALGVFPELAERLDQRAGTLSGGQQQMLAIAQACVVRPRYLLLDELSLGLAPAVIDRLIPVVSGLADDGVGVLLIEQFAVVALGLASQAAVLDRGRVAFSGAADELRRHPEILHGAYLASAS